MEQETRISINKKRPNFLSRKKLLIAGSVFILLSIGFLGGVLFTQSKFENSRIGLRELVNKDLGMPAEVDFAQFWNAWNLIHEKYVDKEKINTQELVFGAIEGMVNALGDPFTNFMTPEVSKKFQEEISGEFSGVGIEIGIRDNQLTVISPIKDTPADRAGIKAGDKIIKIDEKDATGITLQEAVSLIRGKRGTRVILTITRENISSPIEISITRDTIKIPTVSLEFRGDNQNIAHLQIYSFNKNADGDFRKAAQKILSSNIDGIILDVRNNPGGLLDSSIYIASWFLDSGDIVTIERFGDGSEKEFRAENIGSLKHLPVVILINGGSASASEILAGAIRDNRLALTIGEKTFGKGSVQEVFEVRNAGVSTILKITIAKWFTPNGTSIDENGIIPDIEIEIAEEDIGNNRDPQLDRGIEEIEKL